MAPGRGCAVLNMAQARRARCSPSYVDFDVDGRSDSERQSRAAAVQQADNDACRPTPFLVARMVHSCSCLLLFVGKRVWSLEDSWFGQDPTALVVVAVSRVPHSPLVMVCHVSLLRLPGAGCRLPVTSIFSDNVLEVSDK